jgi:hypothetical protein
MMHEMPNSEVLLPFAADDPYARTATQNAINRSCLLAQTRNFHSPRFNVDQTATPDWPESRVMDVEELDVDTLSEISRVPIRSNFRVLARINQLLRDFPEDL